MASQTGAYVRRDPPSLPDRGRYVAEELKRIETAFKTTADIGGKMDKSANLSDVASVATSRNNLGLGSANLDALSGLTGVADSVPVFTGPAALTLFKPGYLYASLHGAVNNGSDCTTAINSLFTAAATQKKIAVIDDLYLISGCTVPSNVTIIGTGEGTLKRVASGIAVGAMLDCSGSGNVRIENLTVDGNKAAQTNPAYSLVMFTGGSGGNVIANCKLKNNNQTGINFIDVLSTAATSVVRGTLIDGCDGGGIGGNKASNIQIEGNTVTNIIGGGITFLHYVFPPEFYPHQNISIRGNTVAYCTTGAGISVLGYFDGGTSSVPYQGFGVQQALNVVIADNTVHDIHSYGIAFQGSYGAVTGNTLNTCGSTSDGGILANGQFSTFSGNSINDSYAFGIDAGGSENCTIANNVIVGTGVRLLPAVGGVALNVGAGSEITVTGNIIKEHTAGGIGLSGYDIGNGVFDVPRDRITVSNNIINSSRSGAKGIEATAGVDDLIITNNRVTLPTPANSFILAAGRSNVSKLVEHGNVADFRGNAAASASTLILQDVGSQFVVSGTTTINNIRTETENSWLGKVRTLTVVNGGSVGEYSPTSPPTPNWSAGSGTGVAGTLLVSNRGQIVACNFSNNGSGYGDGEVFSVTTTGSAVLQGVCSLNITEGKTLTLLFSGATTVTHGVGNLRLAGGANFTTASGSILVLYKWAGLWWEVSRRA